MNDLIDVSSVAPQGLQADGWINRAAAATVAGLAGIAGALSYSHMHQLAQDHGQSGWHAHAFPLSVDGIEIVSSLVLLADRRAGRRSGWLPWTALATGTAGSFAANIATAHPDAVSRAIAGWPALALLVAVKLLSGMLDRQKASGAHAIVADHVRQTIDPAAPAAPNLGTPPGQAGEPLAAAESRPMPAEPRDQRPPSPPPMADADPRFDSRIAALLPAARAARDTLHQSGQSLTRDALAACLRLHGHPIRNASVTPLLRQLRHEQPTNLAA